MNVVICPARHEDVARLFDIERAAGAAFRALDMASVADDEPLAESDLSACQQDGRVWVAVDGADQPVAYLIVDVVGGAAHVEQVSVHPDRARHGPGRRLLDTAEAWSRRYCHAVMTLTTFTDVPWNAPYYTRMGRSASPSRTGSLREPIG